MKLLILQSYSLWLRDLKHFFRRRSRVIGAVGQPVIFWLILASGFRSSFSSPTGVEQEYGDYIFPGILLLIVLFSAVFSTISVIEDRKSGFLQGVLTSPVSTGVFVFSRLLSGTTLALLQAIIFMVLLPFTGISLTVGSVFFVLGVLILSGFILTNIGLLLSWKMKTTQGFHAIMSIVLVPMWVLSGALFPIQGAAGWLQAVIRLNPLYYLASLISRAFVSLETMHDSADPSMLLSIAVCSAMLLILTASSLRVVRVAG